MSEALARIEPRHEVAVRDEMTIEELVGQVQKIQTAMERVMTDGEHYGVIPGTDKPTLLKPGAEKLLLLFRLDPEYEEREQFHADGHYTVTAKCRLYHIPTAQAVASGVGLCTTRESKYAYRNAQRVCPVCGKEAIIKGKAEYGGGWICFAKKDGCGAKFDDGDSRVESQKVGRVPNDALPDSYNTVLKMACKRALVAAVLNGTAASDIFTQDLEDVVEAPVAPAAPTPAAPAPPAPPQQQTTAAAPSAGGEFVFPFGKHKSKPISQVPREYLDWFLSNADGKDDVKAAIRSFLDADQQVLVGEVEADPDDLPF